MGFAHGPNGSCSPHTVSEVTANTSRIHARWVVGTGEGVGVGFGSAKVNPVPNTRARKNMRGVNIFCLKAWSNRARLRARFSLEFHEFVLSVYKIAKFQEIIPGQVKFKIRTLR